MGFVLDSLNDDEHDDGLPDAAFTELELAAGVQHVMRTGNPNATSSGSSSGQWSTRTTYDSDETGIEDQDDAESSHCTTAMRFDTFALAQAWARGNPGSMFKRAADGCGFEGQTRTNPLVNFTSVQVDAYQDRSSRIKALAPYLQNVLSYSASGPRGVRMQPFNRSTWQGELCRLSITELKHLRLLLVTHLAVSRNDLRLLHAAIRRYPKTMSPGDYGEDLSEKLHEIMEEVLAYIDTRLMR